MTNQQAINLLKGLEQRLDDYCELNDEGKTTFRMAIESLELFGNSEHLPSAQPESCEYYALCRHGRDENKLRSVLGFCEYCNEDADGFVTPLEKNGHAFVRFGVSGWELSLKANGWHGSAKIRYCPMCGRDLFVK